MAIARVPRLSRDPRLRLFECEDFDPSLDVFRDLAEKYTMLIFVGDASNLEVRRLFPPTLHIPHSKLPERRLLSNSVELFPATQFLHCSFILRARNVLTSLVRNKE